MPGKNYKVKKTTVFRVDDTNAFRLKMLNWSSRFNIFCFLDNHHYSFAAPAFECLLATGDAGSIMATAGNAFGQLKQFSNTHPGEWLFGHLGYDLKNETEALQSAHEDGIGFPDLHFFIPETVVQLRGEEAWITAEDAAGIYEAINNCAAVIEKENYKAVTVQNKIAKEEYIALIQKLRSHIQRGDCYEINFCQEFFVKNFSVNPLALYAALGDLSPNPFAVFYRLNHKYCIGASPERYLKKKGERIFSQPIKGTAKRMATGAGDEEQKLQMRDSQKEKSEHVMVVDLVRNDLSRICKEGTVQVDELFGLYSFPQVHQMISTVSGEIEDGLHWVDCIKATFPMGSMTGAPKKRVMELIEQYEKTKRGLFSGAIGYVDPAGDFDFNVVIRSMFYEAQKRYLSFQTGGAITFYSDPQQEYEECLLKAAAMVRVLNA